MESSQRVGEDISARLRREHGRRMRERTGSTSKSPLRRYEEIFPQKHADLLAAHLFLGIEIKHLRDDEEVLVVLLHLGPLASREHVFERERMNVELRPERAENVDVPQPVDVDPADALVVEVRQEFLFVGDAALLEVLAVYRSAGEAGAWPLITCLSAPGGSRGWDKGLYITRGRAARDPASLIFPQAQFLPKSDDGQEVADRCLIWVE